MRPDSSLGKAVVHSQIRGDFIRAYAQRKDAYLDASWKAIIHRDEELKALNRKYGYAELDGSFGIGCKSHVDQDYKRDYDAIEERFRKPYDEQLPALYQWSRDSGISIYEYLLIEDIRDEHLKALAGRFEAMGDWELKPIYTKARLEVERLANEFRVGEVRRRLDIMLQHHNYAARRCRKLFAIKIWDISAQRAIVEFGNEWKAALNSAFSQLEAK